MSQTQNRFTGEIPCVEYTTLFEAAGLSPDGMPIDPEEVYSKTAYRAVLDFSNHPDSVVKAKIAIDATETMLNQWPYGDADSACGPNTINERTVLGLVSSLHNANMLEDDLLDVVLSYSVFGGWQISGVYHPSEEYIKETLFSIVNRVYILYGSPGLLPRVYHWVEDKFIREFDQAWIGEFDERIKSQQAVRVGTHVVATELFK